jgi:hypothetical protein
MGIEDWGDIFFLPSKAHERAQQPTRRDRQRVALLAYLGALLDREVSRLGAFGPPKGSDFSA